MRPRPLHILLILGMVMAWGGNVTAVRYVISHGAGPYTVAAFRFTFSLVLISAWIRYTGTPVRITPRQFLLYLPTALLFAAQIALFNYAARFTTAGRLGVILNAYPFWVALFSGLIFIDDRPSVKKITGSLIAVAGIMTIFRESFVGDQLVFKGDTLAFISSLLLMAVILYQKKLLSAGHYPMTILFYMIIFSLPVFYAAAFMLESPGGFIWNGPNLLSILYQGLVVGGVSFIGWQYMLKKYSASILTSFFFLVPCFSVLFGFLLLAEQLTWGLGAGLLLISAGIWFENS